MGKYKDQLQKELEKARLDVGIKFHQAAYNKAGIDMNDPDLQEILYKHFYESSFKLRDIDPQDIIDEYKIRRTTLWKILHK